MIDEPTVAELRATEAAAAALRLLCHDPGAAAIVAHVDQARAAARAMRSGDELTVALHRLLDGIQDCHVVGRSDSPELHQAMFEALVALYAKEQRRN